jgi:uncharacterized protein (TIGR00255 family)
MTGFGAAAGQVGSAQVTVEVRTVNHRFFTPSIKLPSALAKWEGEIRETLRRQVARGHVTLTARVERQVGAELSIDESRFAASVRALKALQERYALDGPLDVATVLRMPDVLSSDGGDADTGSPEQLAEIVNRALAALTAMRDAEGGRLATVLDERLTEIERRLERIAQRAPERLVSERERLRRSVQELTNGIAVDDARLAQEIAVLADRLDVSEELDRFRSHVAAFRETLGASSAGQVGKRLGFLLQEMLREANTTGSKAKDTAMLHEVVAIKEELERLSEQIENIE